MPDDKEGRENNFVQCGFTFTYDRLLLSCMFYQALYVDNLISFHLQVKIIDALRNEKEFRKSSPSRDFPLVRELIFDGS